LALAASPFETATTARWSPSRRARELAAAGGDGDLARERLAEARQLLDANGIVLDPDDAFEFDALALRFSRSPPR
jgi:hypothetical protein